MLNFKQEELLESLVKDITMKYPEIRFVEVTESPEDPESHWVIVTAPEDEDREMALIRYASEKAMDILCDYGYQFLVMPTKEAELEPPEPLIAWTPRMNHNILPTFSKS